MAWGFVSLLTVGTYKLGVLSVVGTLLCFVLVPALGALLVYWLFSTPFFKRYPSKKNPYQNVRNSEMFEQCAAIKQKGAEAVGVLKHRIHKVVWIQVLCFAVLFVLLMISGLTQGTIKPEEFGTGLVTILLVSPAYSIVLYLLRWIERLLFVPLDRLFGALCRARMKKPLGEITESALYEQHFADVNRKYQAKIEREKREKLQKERKRKEYERIAAEHAKNAPVFIDDVMRAAQKSESKSTADSNPDPLGLRDGVRVDTTGI